MVKGELAALAVAGGVASTIGGTYKFVEFLNKAKRMRDVQRANAVYVRSIQRVRRDLDEVKRLLGVRDIKDTLSSNRPKAEWVYTAVRDTRVALENIIPLTENVGNDVEEGRIGVRHRLKWLLSEQEKLENRMEELTTVHASLCEVLGWLTSLEPSEEAREKKRDTRVEIDIEKDPRRYEERDVYVEERGAPRRIEEREVYIEREREAPRRIEERHVHIERERAPAPRVVEQRYYQSGPPAPPPYYEREVRDVRYDAEPQYAEEYYERGPAHPDHYEGPVQEQRIEERRYQRHNGVIDRYEDREPPHDTWMQSTSSQVGTTGAQYGGSRYAHSRGDAGFGDEEIMNPQPVPPTRGYTREVWVEEKPDLNYDQYGNRVHPRSRM